MKLIILAAGQGKRLNSEKLQIPKVMRLACGKPLMGYVLDAADLVNKEDIYAVVGFCKEAVMEAFPELNFVEQKERKGTGHALMCAIDAIRDFDGDVMVINGDMPMFRKETIRKITDAHVESGAACTMATFVVDGEIPPFGHIVRDADGYVAAIVEHKDATEEQKLIRELNAGLYIFKANPLLSALERLTPSPVTGEYYLTELMAILDTMNEKTKPFVLDDEAEVLGVNTEEDLALVESMLKNRKS